MCGIMGYRGPLDGVPIVMEGLARLEYRGYDSAGLALVRGEGTRILRAAGKLQGLREKVAGSRLSGAPALGHTRWATHGPPTEENAHPHQVGPVVVVHNGIFENASELREELARSGVAFRSDTDTEVFAALVARALPESKNLAEAVGKALLAVHGAFSIVVGSETEPETLVGARWGCPLVAGKGAEKGETFFASDIPAILSHTREIFMIEDGEMAVATPAGLSFQDFSGKPLSRAATNISWDPVSAEKGGYRHFMLKEIHEQPTALVNTLGAWFDAAKGRTTLDDLRIPSHPRRILLLACGTSYHAALVGKFWIERFAQIPAEVDIASEFRYRGPILGKEDLAVLLSQSGETADTLAALKEARSKGAATLAICNVPGSSIPRAASATLYTHAGPEVGVAATKTFLTQLTALFLVALHLAEKRASVSEAERAQITHELLCIPAKVERTLALDKPLEDMARRYQNARDFLFLGRGVNYPIALEGALKLKEISYIHAEGYPAGEMKHGPIALLDKDFPTLFLAPRDAGFAKVMSNVEEVRARGAPTLVLTSENGGAAPPAWTHHLSVPKTLDVFYPFLLTPPLQLLAYHVANLKGCDVDQPRNLAKSVTVE